MIDNSALFNELLEQGGIALEPSPFLQGSPEPLPHDLAFDRVEGMLLGLAIGDALGSMTEGLLPDQRANRHSEVRDYLPNPLAGWRQVGLPTDDSQMAFWTLEQLLIDHGLVPKHLAERFAHEEIFGIGQTVYNFVQAYRYGGKSWREAGQPSAGNGALMRIAPLIIPHLGEPSPALWARAGWHDHPQRQSF
jgi:ADP-ribosylglycohydrolase